MKFITGFGLYFLFILSSCNNNSADKHENRNDSEPVKRTFNDLFPRLNKFLREQDSTFSPELFEEAATIDIPDSTALGIEEGELLPYYPYLLFNSDSSFALDMVTYNYLPLQRNGITAMEEQGPDYEVALIDLKKNERRRLLFFGTMGSVMDARWETPNIVIMVGPTEWTDTDSVQMEMWKYIVGDRKLQKFIYPKKIHAAWHKYTQRWMEKNI
jgi:hypothetical protein